LVVDTRLAEPKTYKAKEDKILAEDPSSTISFQLKEIILGLGGSILRESRMLPFPEGKKLEMIRTWLKDASPPKIRVGFIENCIKMSSLYFSLSKRRVGST
jgi:hypothetical protein